MDNPIISVIIAAYNAGKTIRGTLTSLKAQRTGIAFEVIIVDSSTDETPQLINREFPEFTLVHVLERTYPGEARNIGIKKARGEIVAFIDADCIAAADWIDAIAQAHQEGHAAVGGVIGNGNPGSYVGRAAYLLEFVQWMPGTPAGFIADVAAANMSYKRTLFDRLEKGDRFIFCCKK